MERGSSLCLRPLSLALLVLRLTLGNDPTSLEFEEFPALSSLEELRET